MRSPEVKTTINLDELTYGIYACYVTNITNGPPNISAFSGDMGYVYSFNSTPLSISKLWHGIQIFIDTKRNNVYYRTHIYEYDAYNSWILLRK